jgi:hypothetical protein
MDSGGLDDLVMYSIVDGVQMLRIPKSTVSICILQIASAVLCMYIYALYRHKYIWQ